MIGIVRGPGRNYKDCLRTKKVEIDTDRAIEQHKIYAQTLSELGIDLVRLSPLEEFPDSCFVEDTAVIIGDIAIICRLKPASRSGEEEEIGKLLKEHKEVLHIRRPAFLEGGDLLVTHDKVYIGRSGRSDDNGISQLRDILREGRNVIPVDIEDALHLKSVCTLIDEDTLLIREGSGCKGFFKGFRFIEAPHEEECSANVLSIHGKIIMPMGYPRTKERLMGMGHEVIEVDISEFEKGDGGVTCLSILFY
ncbi:MAG: arginine deiminase family protein [Nitrospirota bacterium]